MYVTEILHSFQSFLQLRRVGFKLKKSISNLWLSPCQTKPSYPSCNPTQAYGHHWCKNTTFPSAIPATGAQNSLISSTPISDTAFKSIRHKNMLEVFLLFAFLLGVYFLNLCNSPQITFLQFSLEKLFPFQRKLRLSCISLIQRSHEALRFF